MFVIPCKYSNSSSGITNLVRQIRTFHHDEKIMVVDSNSSDKSYFEEVRSYGAIVEDIQNINWMVGAYWHGYHKFPEENYYFFFHDSINVKANLDYLKEKDFFMLATFNRMVAPSFNSWNERIRGETSLPREAIKLEGKGCYGPIFGCKNHIMKQFQKWGVHKLLPSNKAETGYLEGAYGLFFEALGFDVAAHTLYGDILELESPNGKSGPPPHNTSWQFPIEKYYASHNDESRLK